jgi:hypothetical protein
MSSESIKFGSGSFVGHLASDPEFPEMSDQLLAEYVGYSVGCPVVQELTLPESGRGGPEAMARRYGEVGFWFRYMARRSEELNPGLAYVFETSYKRLGHEAVGHYEPQSVPPQYSKYMPPTETLVGYALPRLFIDHIGTNQDIPEEERAVRLKSGLEFIEESIYEAESGEDLLALMAEKIVKSGTVEPIEALQRILGTGWYKLQNSRTQAGNLMPALLKRSKKNLLQLYVFMSPEEKERHKILEV